MIDYSKPGKTAPGTKHLRPEREQQVTWLDFVAPGPAPVASGRIEQDDVQHPVMARKMRRLDQAHRDRRQRKGQRAFYRSQIEGARRRDIVEAQMAVLAAGPTAPGNLHRFRNVFNSMLAQHGEALLATQS